MMNLQNKKIVEDIISRKIYILGAGAIGGLVGARLTSVFGKENIVLIDTDLEHVRAIRKSGLKILDEGQKKPRLENIDVQIATPDMVDKSEMENVILATKTYSNDRALEGLDETIPMLVLQNGYDERVWRFKNATHGIEFGFGCQVKKPGYIYNAVKGKYVFGDMHKISFRTKIWGQILNIAGIKTEIKPNIMGYLWSKLLINSTLNPLSAIYDYSFKEIIETPESRQLFKKLYLEGYPVVKRRTSELGEKLGSFIGPPDLVNRIFQNEKLSDFMLKKVANKFGEVESSMLQDVRRNRPTEIEEINGAIIILGKKYGMETPENELVYEKVKKLEPNYSFSLTTGKRK